MIDCSVRTSIVKECIYQVWNLNDNKMNEKVNGVFFRLIKYNRFEKI